MVTRTIGQMLKKILKTFRVEYGSFWRNVSDYRSLFGSFGGIAFSPYFHFACISAALVVFFSDKPDAWMQATQGMLPELLGFSLGGYAILISFGDEQFRKFLATFYPNGNKHSIFMILNGVFLHFIIAQVLAILISVFISAYDIKNIYVNFIGCMAFFYAASFCIAVAFEVKSVSSWYQNYVKTMNK